MASAIAQMSPIMTTSAAVASKVIESNRVVLNSSLRFAGLAIRYEVPINTAPNATVGIWAITGFKTRTTKIRKRACVIAEIRLRALDRILTLVRAIAASCQSAGS